MAEIEQKIRMRAEVSPSTFKAYQKAIDEFARATGKAISPSAGAERDVRTMMVDYIETP